MMTSVLVFLDYRFGGTTTSSEQVRTARMTHACTHCDAPPLTARPHAAAALCTSADALARLRGTRCSLPPRATPPPPYPQFSTAGRTIKAGLTACDIVSKWTWAATLLQVRACLRPGHNENVTC